jgi:hypothetical protein
MTSLKTVTVSSPEVRRGRRWPRIQAVSERRGMGETISRRKRTPDLLGYWTGMYKMTKSLDDMWTERAKNVIRSKIFNARSKGQCIEKKLVPGLTMARKR